jgi:endonuclease/exonuclease/phosphatase family metal-dependent hydrolase
MTIIRLVTWNVASARLPEPDLDAVANVLKDLDPDVVALQERDRVRERSGGADQAAALAEALGMSSWYARRCCTTTRSDRPGDRCPRAPRTPAAPPTGSGCLIVGLGRLLVAPGPPGAGRRPQPASDLRAGDVAAPAPVRVWRPVVRGRTFPREAPGRQLDHVLVAGRGLAARSGRVAEARVSDHLPVVVELEPR